MIKNNDKLQSYKKVN